MTQDTPASGSPVNMPLSTAINSPRGAQAHAPEQRPEQPRPSSEARDPAPRRRAGLRAWEEVGSEYKHLALPPPPPPLSRFIPDQSASATGSDSVGYPGAGRRAVGAGATRDCGASDDEDDDDD
jgi:hypothetical protein